MIGNDIIDLSLAKKQSNWQRKGFLEKQFTPKEQAIIYASEKPFMMVWRLWSMKESVYKIIVQQEKRRFFAPLKFECQVISETKGKVVYQDQLFHTITSSNRKYIYTSVNKSQFKKIWKVEEPKKEKILSWIEEILEISSAKIQKNVFGIPNIFHQGRQISKSLTITHHGKYSAAELILI